MLPYTYKNGGVFVQRNLNSSLRSLFLVYKIVMRVENDEEGATAYDVEGRHYEREYLR